MSWLNSSLSTLKGQLTTLAQEVLAETAGPGDAEYRRDEVDTRTALELLSDTQKEKEELDKLCNEKDAEIVLLHKQINELQNKISDSGGGGNTTATTSTPNVGTSKSPTNNNTVLEDSWCWEPDNVKTDNDHSSETSSSGNGNEMVNITLEEVPLGFSERTSKRRGAQRAASGELQRRVQQLEEENKQLNAALEELDSQHNLAMQNVLELKTDLQQKLATVTSSYEALKQEHADKFIKGELEVGQLKKQLVALQQEQTTFAAEKHEMQQKITNYDAELKKTMIELADLQALLDKKNQDNVELIEKVKAAGRVADKAEEECTELQQKVVQLLKEVEEAKQTKEKKTSESSTSSTGKHSEDEFIVVREGDANSSGPTTPPSKEELKDKIVQLENRVSELTLENGSLALKLQDREMEKELAMNVLRENMQSLQLRCEETNAELDAAKEQLEEQQERLDALKEKAAEAIIAQEQLKALADEKTKIEVEITSMKENLKSVLELEKRLLLSEGEKESLQLELQSLRASKDRNAELEGKVQSLILENQQLRLNVEAETEAQNYSAELAETMKALREENESLRTEVLSMAQVKFSEAIAEQKQEITDLDAEDEELFTLDKLKELLRTCVKSGSSENVDEAIMRDCKSLHERINKINSLEKNLSRMSEEVLDLQDSKLVWDHEKKTLEADISQYILQCDELMKNNEILLNELENYKRNKLETIHEHNEESVVQLEAQLEESTKLNQTLELEYAELNKKIDELEEEKQTLTEEYRATQQGNTELQTRERDFKLQLETLELEKVNLLFELNELKSADAKDVGTDVNEPLRYVEEKCQSLESQLARLSKDHSDLVAAMQAQKAALQEANKKREESEKALAEQETVMLRMTADLKTLQQQRQQQEDVTRQLDDLAAQHQRLKQELMAKDIVGETQKRDLQMLQQRTVEYETLLEVRQALEEELQVKGELLEQLQADLEQKTRKNEELLDDLREQSFNSEQLAQLKQEKETLLEEFTELKQNYEAHCTELKRLQEAETKTTSGDAATLARLAQLETELLATADLQKSVEMLSYEKNEMIKALQQKHSENMQYYMEIQRLQPIVQQLQQQLAAPTVEQKPCDKCPALENTLTELRNELEKQHDQIKFLKEKSDILTTNLLTEQTNQRLVQQEKAEVEEQNATLRKDLERLREHLLEIEDMHTQDTVEMQRELEETKAQMMALQADVTKSSTAYTSASIRANQHAETLQAQYALLVQQRDELVNKLSLAEDRESKNQAALCNLQCALEQFQNDKELDIKAATQRIRKELQQELDKQTLLHTEIATLQQKLEEANQGLRAASRLSDQLEASQQQIVALREEVETLQQRNNNLSEQLNSSESSQTDKIDKNLIKSLLIGYVVSSNPNDKNQVLRMISSVLDFTPTEADKVGLNKQQTSWLGAILGGGSGAAGTQGAHSKDNLVQAFVQFLEQESQPQMNPNNMPNLLNMTQQQSSTSAGAAANARRTSTGSNSGAPTSNSATPLPIQPLMLNSNVLSEFAPTRSSSSILKDILSDS